MYTVHGQEADIHFFLLFGHGPILVQINLQHSQRNPTAYALALKYNKIYLLIEITFLSRKICISRSFFYVILCYLKLGITIFQEKKRPKSIMLFIVYLYFSYSFAQRSNNILYDKQNWLHHTHKRKQ